jgi:hypothetical protein
MRVSAAAFVRPLASEDVSGDGCLVERWARGVVVATADGLGHGPAAAAASGAFLRLVREGREAPLPVLLEATHRALSKGRGAVAAVARFDEQARTVEVAGLGNITVFVASGSAEPKHCVIPAGVLGSAFRTIRPQVLGFAEGDALVLHTDGVSGRFPFERFRSLEPEALAQAIVKTYGKPSDDAACAVAVGVAASAPEHPASGEARSMTLAFRVAGDADCAAVAARDFASRGGFGMKAQWQLGIAVSELVTHVLESGGAGALTMTLAREPRECIVVETAHPWPAPGQGLGPDLGSVRRMMDDVAIDTDPAGTRVVARKYR